MQPYEGDYVGDIPWMDFRNFRNFAASVFIRMDWRV